jgi:metal-dependent amidase/aminoacylase/carboxypeptidase family protein
MQELLQQAKRLEEELVAFRRDLHRQPELSFEEAETAAKVARQLESLGLT